MAAARPRPLRIGELARAAGLSTDTLRHYERLGLLACAFRTPGGFRMYAPEALSRVRSVQAALGLGFTLRELASLQRARAAGRPPCRAARRLAGERLAGVERELARLTALRALLRDVLATWDRQLARAPEGSALRLLESLADATALPAKGNDHESQPRTLAASRAAARVRMRRSS